MWKDLQKILFVKLSNFPHGERFANFLVANICCLTSPSCFSHQWCYHNGQLLRGFTLYAWKLASGKLLVVAHIRPIRRKKKDLNLIIQLPFAHCTRGGPPSCTIMLSSSRSGGIWQCSCNLNSYIMFLLERHTSQAIPTYVKSATANSHNFLQGVIEP